MLKAILAIVVSLTLSSLGYAKPNCAKASTTEACAKVKGCTWDEAASACKAGKGGKTAAKAKKEKVAKKEKKAAAKAETAPAAEAPAVEEGAPAEAAPESLPADDAEDLEDM